MKKTYRKPLTCMINQYQERDLLSSSTGHLWNDVGNFGFGDDEDDDREGDDNWDHDWSWGD